MRKILFILLALFVTTINGYAQANLQNSVPVDAGAAAQSPMVRLGLIEGDKATTQQLLDNLKIGLIVGRVSNHRVASYRLTIIPKEGDMRISKPIKGGRMPEDVFDQMQLASVKKGDTIIFEDVKITDDQNRERVMNHIVITIQ